MNEISNVSDKCGEANAGKFAITSYVTNVYNHVEIEARCYELSSRQEEDASYSDFVDDFRFHCGCPVIIKVARKTGCHRESTCAKVDERTVPKASGIAPRVQASSSQLCNGGNCRMFISSVDMNGNLGGLRGADATCQARATAARLPGTYKAWLSDSNESPSTRFTQSTRPYVRVDGQVVANNWDEPHERFNPERSS